MKIELSRQSKGAIGESYVLLRMLARGYTAANLNLSVSNTKSFDLICGNSDMSKYVPVQVKASFDKSRSFNIGLTHGDFMTNGVFDETKAMQSLKEKIRCPWIFVNVDTSTPIPQFRLFVLSAEQTIKLAYESEKWYINGVQHVKALADNGTVALVLGWIEGFDTQPSKTRVLFKNPFSVGHFEEAWENLGID